MKNIITLAIATTALLVIATPVQANDETSPAEPTEEATSLTYEQRRDARVRQARAQADAMQTNETRVVRTVQTQAGYESMVINALAQGITALVSEMETARFHAQHEKAVDRSIAELERNAEYPALEAERKARIAEAKARVAEAQVRLIKAERELALLKSAATNAADKVK